MKHLRTDVCLHHPGPSNATTRFKRTSVMDFVFYDHTQLRLVQRSVKVVHIVPFVLSTELKPLGYENMWEAEVITLIGQSIVPDERVVIWVALKHVVISLVPKIGLKTVAVPLGVKVLRTGIHVNTHIRHVQGKNSLGNTNPTSNSSITPWTWGLEAVPRQDNNMCMYLQPQHAGIPVHTMCSFCMHWHILADNFDRDDEMRSFWFIKHMFEPATQA